MVLVMLRSVEIRLAFKCPGCDRAVPLNGIYRMAKCQDCQELLNVPKLRQGKGWRELLHFGNPNYSVFAGAMMMKLGGSESGAFAPIKLDARRAWPSCIGCKKTLPQSAFAEAESLGDSVHCPDCGEGLSLHPAPKLLTKPYPCARWIVGGAVELRNVSAEPEFEKLSQPVVMKCLSCSATLRIDGTQRLVPCVYCKSPNYLPDDLWLAIHPRPKREPWYVLFDEEMAIAKMGTWERSQIKK